MKVDFDRAAELASRVIPVDSMQLELSQAIFRAVREQTEWLMELVCSDCGGKDGECFHALSHSWWCPKCNVPVMAEYVTFNQLHDPRSGGCGTAVVATPEAVTRAEHLHRKGEKP